LDLGLIVALASLGFTALGSVVAVIGIRQTRASRGRAVIVNYGSARGLLQRRFGGTSKNTEAALSVIARSIFVNGTGRTVFGVWDRMTSSVFLDLFSASTILSDRAIIARLVSDNIRGNTKIERPTHVAVAKEGNVLVADEVMRQLDLTLIVVRTKEAIRFGNPIEGLLPNGAYVIIVDDVAADGKMLARVVKRVRQYGGRVEHAFCAVERMDGNSSEALMACDVTLVAPMKLDERTLRELRHLPASVPRDESFDHPPLRGTTEN
jgi:orotate phosphoribosyltransferase